MDSLHGLPVYFVAPALVILVAVVVYVILKSLREGREVSFWPPKIGARPTLENVGGGKTADRSSPEARDDPFSSAMASPGTVLRDVAQVGKFPDNALAFLYVESGSIAGATFVLTTSGQSYLFGHNETCDFMIPGVSRAQFRIHVRRQEGATTSLRPYNLELQELGSQIPIWVDGVNAERASVALKDHTIIETGGLKIRVLKVPG
jgi:hypothetical protein